MKRHRAMRHHRQKPHETLLTKKLFLALLKRDVRGMNRVLDAGAYPGANMVPFGFPGSVTMAKAVGRFVAVEDGRHADAEYPVFSLAVVHACVHPTELHHLQVVKEMLAQYPESVFATSQGLVALADDGRRVGIQDGLNALQFVCRLAGIFGFEIPTDLTCVLISTSLEHDARISSPLKLLNKLHDEDTASGDSLADLVIRCSDGVTEIPAHKTILMAASRYFGCLFNKYWCHAIENGVWDCQVSPVVMKAIKQYIYTGVVCMHELSQEHVQELFLVSHRYELLNLFHLSKTFLIDSLSPANVNALLSLAVERDEDAADLIDACRSIMPESPVDKQAIGVR